MPRIAWKWEDPTAGTVEYMSINPKAGASPTYTKSLSKKTTTAGGQVLIMEGADPPMQFDFSGSILTEAQYTFLYDAWAKRHPVAVTDDLGRTFRIYLESFTPTREISRTNPWKHSYSASAVIVG